MPRLALCTWLAALALPAAAHATTMRLLAPEELVAGAERIVVGTIETRQSFWDGMRIFTRQRLTVEETWKGATAQVLDVLTEGGVVGDIGQAVAGSAHLKVGDRVVLYLVRDRRDGPGAWLVEGMWQGAFHVDAGAALHRDSDGATLVGAAIPPPATLVELRQQTIQLVR